MTGVQTCALPISDEFTVISYDRRGNGRSPTPDGWQTTSPEEQADDAAGLLDALGTGPAAVFGTSSGGVYALCLMVRYPGSVRGALLHEPGLYALVDDFDAVRAPLRAVVQKAMAAGGLPAAVERFWCYVAGDDGWPEQVRGASVTAPGLYWVGLPFLFSFSSMLVGGVGRDAARVAKQIIAGAPAPERVARMSPA